jgi:hypothetical protein
MLVVIDYFTKWTEVVALKNMTHKEVIEFVTEHVSHRFNISQTNQINISSIPLLFALGVAGNVAVGV